MSKNQTLVKKLCEPFCAYYKPGRNEELLCRGAQVFNRLVREGKPIVPAKLGMQSDPQAIELIVNSMCIACDFHEHDCDFMEDRGKPACGGFVLLSQLVACGQIEIKEIMESRGSLR